MQSSCPVHKPICQKILANWLLWAVSPVKRPARNWIVPRDKCVVDSIRDGSAKEE